MLVLSCKKDDPAEECQDVSDATPTLVLPDVPDDYSLNLPAHISGDQQLAIYAANNNSLGNFTTDAGATLGRVLFYDKRLSENNSISCSSCHFQSNAFSDPATFSEGIHGQMTGRNSMTLLNMRYFRDFFWDMSASLLENQVLQPIAHPGEMDSDLDALILELEEVEEYPQLFDAAFGDDQVSTERISYALAQFIRSMVSFESKFDEGYVSEYTNFTQLELDGKDVFFNAGTRCNQCHTGLNFFTRLEPMMNGLESDPVDPGYFAVTGNAENNGQFKVKSLRNIELTAPYMHDGRFETLEEVVEHYNSGIQPHPNLDGRLTVEYEDGGTPLEMNLSEYEKEALVAFLKTLTDHTIAEDQRFSDPFVYE